jgi:hypothetical protein
MSKCESRIWRDREPARKGDPLPSVYTKYKKQKHVRFGPIERVTHVHAKCEVVMVTFGAAGPAFDSERPAYWRIGRDENHPEF